MNKFNNYKTIQIGKNGVSVVKWLFAYHRENHTNIKTSQKVKTKTKYERGSFHKFC